MGSSSSSAFIPAFNINKQLPVKSVVRIYVRERRTDTVVYARAVLHSGRLVAGGLVA